MSALDLSVNGRRVTAQVEPRMQLAEFLREHLSLTGTHLGCEHGVCGACTIDIDGAPARSCITYAVACHGSAVRTIEGYEDDAVMAELREAFSAEHALQCGYCTPGMLVTARDIVTRIPHADEERIRKELAGNLCRCTGYVGIVRAIQRVLAARQGQPTTSGAFHDSTALALRSSGVEDSTAVLPPRKPATSETRWGPSAAESKEQRRSTAPALHQTFTIDQPLDTVWAFFSDLAQVTACLPGATVVGTPTDDHVDLKLKVKVGPIAPEFEGGADVTRDPRTYTGSIRGAARDARSSSATRGEIRYVLVNEGAATRVDVDVEYALTGTLAQFGRSGIVRDIASAMTKQFAANVRSALAGDEYPAERTELNALALFWNAICSRVKRMLGR